MGAIENVVDFGQVAEMKIDGYHTRGYGSDGEPAYKWLSLRNGKGKIFFLVDEGGVMVLKTAKQMQKKKGRR